MVTPWGSRFSRAPALHRPSSVASKNPRRSLKLSFPGKMVRSSLHLYTRDFYATTANYELGKHRILSQQFDKGEKKSHRHTETVAQPCRFCGKPTTNLYANIPICPECARSKRLN